MTRKDYTAIASKFMQAKLDVLGKEPYEYRSHMIDGISLSAEHIADALRADNPRFDRARFLKACGVAE